MSAVPCTSARKMSSRDPTPSRAVLEGQVDAARTALCQVISSSGADDALSAHAIREMIRGLKESCSTYSKLNKQLIALLQRQGVYSMANDLTAERMELVYSDTRKAVHALNEVLERQHEETASSIGTYAPSVTGTSISEEDARETAHVVAASDVSPATHVVTQAATESSSMAQAVASHTGIGAHAVAPHTPHSEPPTFANHSAVGAHAVAPTTQAHRAQAVANISTSGAHAVAPNAAYLVTQAVTAPLSAPVANIPHPAVTMQPTSLLTSTQHAFTTPLLGTHNFIPPLSSMQFAPTTLHVGAAPFYPASSNPVNSFPLSSQPPAAASLHPPTTAHCAFAPQHAAMVSQPQVHHQPAPSIIFSVAAPSLAHSSQRSQENHESISQAADSEQHVNFSAQANQDEDIEVLDQFARLQLKKDLLNGLGEPFDGNPERFWMWHVNISRSLVEAQVGPLDTLRILVANTKGRVNEMIQEEVAAGIRQPRATLDRLWKELKRMYGDGTLIAEAIQSRLAHFPAVKSASQTTQLQKLLGLCKSIRSLKPDCRELSRFDDKLGMREVWSKFPESFQNSWRKQFCRHEEATGSYLPFSALVEAAERYVHDVTSPAFSTFSSKVSTTAVKTLKTTSSTEQVTCPYHGRGNHPLTECSKFQRLPVNERHTFVRDNKICFNCFGSHRVANCNSSSRCSKCNARHSTLLHQEKQQRSSGVSYNNGNGQHGVKSTCTAVCGPTGSSKIRSKTVLVDVKAVGSEKTLQCLCVIDEQSNSTFCDPQVLDFFKLSAPSHDYDITTMTGMTFNVGGNMVRGLSVKGANEDEWIDLPPTITNASIPDSRNEYTTPEIVAAHSHIRQYAKHFRNLPENAQVLLLVGANCGPAMRTQVFGSKFPFVHHTALGWALTGPVCLNNGTQKEHSVKALRTATYPPSSCEQFVSTRATFSSCAPTLIHESEVFRETPDDEVTDLSQDDKKFLIKMNDNVCINASGNIQLPLPLKDKYELPVNQTAVYQRTKSTLHALKRKPDDLGQCLEIMDKYLTRGHVEQVPACDVTSNNPVNYIPVFPVSQPQKNKIRLVFDSSASYSGKSLNKCLIQGPDDNNKLTAVLTRFRDGPVGFAADIECMYHSFHVPPEQRDLQRFYWFQNNDPTLDIVPHRALVHVFGNCSSPAVAIFGLRYTTRGVEPALQEAADLINHNMYVDDALGSAASPQDAVQTLQDARSILDRFNIRLHKIKSNSPIVTSAFPSVDVAEHDGVSLSPNSLYKTLGLVWKSNSDEFVIDCSIPARESTKRGLLSSTNSIFDPLGMVSPVALSGRLIQRSIMSSSSTSPETHKYDWDDPLPEDKLKPWHQWVSSVNKNPLVTLSRSFTPGDFGTVVTRELIVFCDASVQAIGHVAYLRVTNDKNEILLTFIHASSKVAPRAATSVPRLELCAATEAALAARNIADQLGQKLNFTVFFSDSTVTLSYIRNTTKRFSRYVTSRVDQILKVSSPEQWKYVNTQDNPADLASRPQLPEQLMNSIWFTGPDFLRLNPLAEDQEMDVSDLPETIPAEKVLASVSTPANPVASAICKRISNWTTAVRIAALVHKFCSTLLSKVKKNWCQDTNTRDAATQLLIKTAQAECFSSTINSLHRKKIVSSTDQLLSLAPFLDEHGILRVGGRLRNSDMPFGVKHPVLLPAKHPVTLMLLKHHHERTYHQGRVVTVSYLRQAGYHIHKSRTVISNFLACCATCRKLRALPEQQLMSNLPVDRMEESPPFTNIGIDFFGPFLVHDGKTTRRTKATKKMWGCLFTCLVSRAVHIETVTSMDAPTFRLAFQRFLAVRGQCKFVRSDCGTNLTCVRRQLNKENNEIGQSIVGDVAKELGLDWQLTPPLSSHSGGVWERKISSVKSILKGALKCLGQRYFSREELQTYLQEAAAIINNTPMCDASVNPNDGFPVTPANLLTLKTCPNPPPLETFTTEDILAYGPRRWRRVMEVSSQFWKLWHRHYLSRLQERHKWNTAHRRLKVGDVVLMRTSAHRNEWPLARVVEVKRSSDDLPRVVTLRLPSLDKRPHRQAIRSVHDVVFVTSGES